MSQTNRRHFLKTSAVVAGAATVAAPAIAQSSKSANDRLRIGLLGTGNRMKFHVRSLAQLADQNVEVVAACDCDQNKLDSLAKRYPELRDKKLTTYTDMRKMLDDPSIDAVVNATGDRWHSLSTIWACQAGKDVYVEKPGMHNLFEGRQMVAAAHKYNRMVQHGTQNRSSPNIIDGIKKLKEGVIGDLYMARGLDYKSYGNLGRIKHRPVPKGLDWDQWLGPKPMQPYSHFWHRRWHFILELASGGFANQAVHELDVVRWGLGLNELPKHVTAVGGKYFPQDDRTSPTNVAITYQFDNPQPPMVTYENRAWYSNGEAGFRDKYQFVQPQYPAGTIFFGTKGYLIFFPTTAATTPFSAARPNRGPARQPRDSR